MRWHASGSNYPVRLSLSSLSPPTTWKIWHNDRVRRTLRGSGASPPNKGPCIKASSPVALAMKYTFAHSHLRQKPSACDNCKPKPELLEFLNSSVVPQLGGFKLPAQQKNQSPQKSVTCGFKYVNNIFPNDNNNILRGFKAIILLFCLEVNWQQRDVLTLRVPTSSQKRQLAPRHHLISSLQRHFDTRPNKGKVKQRLPL